MSTPPDIFTGRRSTLLARLADASRGGPAHAALLFGAHHHLRNGDAIANVNTLIYTLINLRVLQRIRQKLANSAQP